MAAGPARLIRLLILGCLLANSPSTGWAQPFLLPIEWTASIAIQEEYNDNFFLTESGRKPDFSTSLIPGLSLRLSSGQSEATLSYRLSAVQSTALSDELRLLHQLKGSGDLALGERLSLRPREEFIRSDEPATTDPLGIQRERPILERNSAGLELAYTGDQGSGSLLYGNTFSSETGGAGERSNIHTLGAKGRMDLPLARTAITAGYEYVLSEFRIGDDFRGHQVDVGVSRQFDPLTEAALSGTASFRDFRTGEDLWIWRGAGRVTREFTPLLVGEGQVGYQAAEGVEGTGSKGLTWSIRVTWTGPSLRTSLVGAEAIQESFQERRNVGLFRSRDLSVDTAYTPTDRLTLTARISYGQRRFLQGANRSREDDLYGGELGLSYKLSRTLSLSAGYTYGRRDSNAQGFGYKNNRVRIDLTAGF